LLPQQREIGIETERPAISWGWFVSVGERSMDWGRFSYRLAVSAAALSTPTLIDILFAITFIHDILNFVFMFALLLSFLLSIVAMVIAIVSSMPKKSVLKTIAIAIVPFVVLGIGALPISGILRPLVGLERL
jgi:hypothetical protein